MLKTMVFAAGCTLFSVACLGNGDDAKSPSNGATGDLSGAAAAPASSPTVEDERVGKFNIASLVRSRVQKLAPTDAWKPSLTAADSAVGEETKATFDPEAFAATRDLRVWMGVEK